MSGLHLIIVMCIIITMNIYITTPNEKNLRQLEDWSMSGLVNYLLSDYFKTHTIKDVKRIEKAANVKPEDLEGTVFEKGAPETPPKEEVLTHKQTTLPGGTKAFTYDEPPKKTTKFCKHNAALGFCKFGCKK